MVGMGIPDNLTQTKGVQKGYTDGGGSSFP